MSDPIYHITSGTAWSAALQMGAYQANSLQAEGFIHCSTVDQVLRVANNFYKGQSDLVLLVIDVTRLRSELRWEPGSDKPDELFPHIYGPIGLDAVVRAVDFRPDADGLWRSLPE